MQFSEAVQDEEAPVSSSARSEMFIASNLKALSSVRSDM
jgi:hypothetical protein